MNSYIAPEYLLMEENLDDFIREHNLDYISIRSLIRGSVEILEQEPSNASIAFIDANNPQTGTSIKLGNIKFNIKFALNTLFSIKTVCDTKGMWSILALIKALCTFLTDIHITFGQNDAIVLFCIYRLQSATEEQILDYYNNNTFLFKNDDIILDKGLVETSLKNLEKLGIINLINGGYYIKEWIIVKNNK